MSGASDKVEAPISAGRARSLANLKPFQKGRSGNPTGKNGKENKTIKTVAEIANDNSAKAMQALVKLIGSSDEKVSLAAAQAVLDRAVGKPKQTVEKTTKTEASDYSTAELLSIAGVGSKRAAETPGREREPDRLQ